MIFHCAHPTTFFGALSPPHISSGVTRPGFLRTSSEHILIVRALRARRTAGCSRSSSLLLPLSPLAHLVRVSEAIPTAAVERPLSEVGVPGAKESPH